MKFVSVRDLRGRSGDIWRELPAEREMVITNNGRPVAILVEEALASFRRARAVDAVASLQRRSVAGGTNELADADISDEIAAARRARRR